MAPHLRSFSTVLGERTNSQRRYDDFACGVSRQGAAQYKCWLVSWTHPVRRERDTVKIPSCAEVVDASCRYRTADRVQGSYLKKNHSDTCFESSRKCDESSLVRHYGGMVGLRAPHMLLRWHEGTLVTVDSEGPKLGIE